ncbi:uncharacterized protein BDZ83DRAFT_746318 [Colletotrichum acutatum]|uniref:Uncharacterized protein n=1 Tax=Glomerella acutata TaxID=27357 RepID=A0AAD9D3X0_GLOAC|nr:uncharacterized protein BDZ83DRAFT_746318 [Colletotrichum acutatum]KAK1731921.1 hypothetical protein BDZ83DRAFT_746318 [Colletotrichum acutatum]
MCRRVYKYYTACGCVLNALFYHKCAYGSASPLCKEEDGIVTHDGETCPYHTCVARRQARSRRRANGGGRTQDSENIRASVENPFTFTGAGKEITPTKLEDRHKLGDFQVFIKDIDTFLKKLSERDNGIRTKTQIEAQAESQIVRKSNKREGKNNQLKDRKVSRELSPLAGCSDWTDDDENDNAIARRKIRDRLKKEFRALVRENERNKELFDASDVFMSSGCGDDEDASDSSSSESDPGDAYPSPMSMSPHPGNYGDVSESNESPDQGDVHSSSSSLSPDHGDGSVVPESSGDSDHGNMQSSIPGPAHRSDPLPAFLSWDTSPEHSEDMEENEEIDEDGDEPDYDSHDADMPDADEDNGDYVPEPTWPPTGVEWTSKLKYMTGISRRDYW